MIPFSWQASGSITLAGDMRVNGGVKKSVTAC
jgi:hypothetical protein